MKQPAVIYSRDHDRPFTQLSVDEVNAVTQLWRDLYNRVEQDTSGV